MHKQRFVSKSWQALAIVPVVVISVIPRWLRIGAALAAMLLIVSTGQTPQAHAQIDVERYIVSVSNPDDKLCLGESVTYLVSIRVEQRIGVVPDNEARTPFRVGVSLSAESANPTIGDFTRTGSPILSQGADPDSYRADTFPFTFKAKKAGKTTLRFKATVVGSSALPVSLDVTVIPCHLKVMSIGRWSASYPAGSIKIFAASLLTELEGDSLYPSFSGEGTMIYLTQIATRGCPDAGAIGVGTVDISAGYQIDRDLLEVELEYKPADMHEVATCPTGTATHDSKVSLNSLKISGRIRTWVYTASQTITSSDGMSATSNVKVIVIVGPEN